MVISFRSLVVLISFALRSSIRIHFRWRKIQCEIFGKRYDLEIGCIPSTSVFSRQIHSTNAPNSPSPHYYKFEGWIKSPIIFYPKLSRYPNKHNIFISVFNQLDAQNLFYNKFYFMPLHVSDTCAHHQEVKIALRSLWYHHTYRCDRCDDTSWPPDDKHICSKHVEAWNKTYCKTNFVHQVG